MTMKVFSCFNSMLLMTFLVLKIYQFEKKKFVYCNYQGYGFGFNLVYISIFICQLTCNHLIDYSRFCLFKISGNI